MKAPLDQLVDSIARLPEDWHGAGSVGRNVLSAMIRHAAASGPVRHSAETGSGKTTVLLSHLSQDHTVFAVDAGNSVSQVKQSALFNPASTTFVEGPTQRTLPAHRFVHTQPRVDRWAARISVSGSGVLLPVSDNRDGWLAHHRRLAHSKHRADV